MLSVSQQNLRVAKSHKTQVDLSENKIASQQETVAPFRVPLGAVLK